MRFKGKRWPLIDIEDKNLQRAGLSRLPRWFASRHVTFSSKTRLDRNISDRGGDCQTSNRSRRECRVTPAEGGRQCASRLSGNAPAAYLVKTSLRQSDCGYRNSSRPASLRRHCIRTSIKAGRAEITTYETFRCSFLPLTICLRIRNPRIGGSVFAALAARRRCGTRGRSRPVPTVPANTLAPAFLWQAASRC